MLPFQSLYQNFLNFFRENLWRDPLYQDKPLLFRLIKLLRIFYLIARGFLRHECLTRATSLTYTTLLSLVPFWVLLFAFASKFAAQKTNQIQLYLTNLFSPSQIEGESHALSEHAQTFINGFMDIVKQIDLERFNGIGLFFLFLTSVSVLSHMEYSFNHIWGIRKGRFWLHKIFVYAIILALLPIMILLSISLTAGFETVKGLGLQQMESFVAYAHLADDSSPLQSFTLWLLESVRVFGHWVSYYLPICFSWLSLWFLYLYLPYTKVRWKIALVGSGIAAILFELAKIIFSHYVHSFLDAGNIGKVYGALSFLPVMLLWIYLVWLIVLLGAEISHALQNVKSYQKEQMWSLVSEKNKNIELLRLCFFLYLQREKGVPLEKVLSYEDLPSSFIEECLEKMEKANLVSGDFKESDVVKWVCPKSFSVKELWLDIQSVGGDFEGITTPEDLIAQSYIEIYK